MSRQLVRYKILLFLVMSLLSISVARMSFSQEFTATSLGDYGNVTVLEASGDYRAKNADGSVNSSPREAIAKEFFKTHKDEYDFVVIFTNFDFPMPDDGQAKAFYLGVKNDTPGLGKEPFNNSAAFGSARLQGVIDMGNLTTIASDPLDPRFNETLYILSHELMHRWGAHVKFKQADGSLSTALLGKDQDHWSYLLNSGGSLLYGNAWQDNKNGTFTSTTPQNQMKFYSPLDLYLMGMIDKSKVPPMLLIENPDVDPARLPEAGVTITGTARTVTIDDIIAAVGERIPNASNSQKSFKAAFIYITTPGTFNADAIYQIENIRNGFVTRHSILTDGQSIVEVASTPKEEVPVNPGILPPSTTPRTLPPDINQGVQWLMSNQKTDGSWSDVPETMERDTAEAVLVLKTFSEAQTSYSSGLQWLATSSSGNMDYLSRKIEASQASNQDVSGLVAELLSRRNSDGGWGSDRWYKSNSMDTSLALKTLSLTGYSDQAIVTKAIEYLKSNQKPDGGWTGNGESTIQTTAHVLIAFSKYGKDYPVSDYVSKGVQWLLTKQNLDGGFGPSAGSTGSPQASSGQGASSTVYDTALAILALRELNASTEITNKGLAYLLGQQSGDGSWNNSAYQTAIAVGAIYKATVDPDLSIKSEDILIIPDKIRSLPSNIVINANISNLGQTSAQAKVVLYKDSISDANKIGEQTLAFPGQSTTAVTFFATASDGSEHRFYIVLDPDYQVKESNELNNTAIKVLYPEATYDFEVLLQDIIVSPNLTDMFSDVKVTSKITNKGTMNAYNVQVKYLIDDPATPFDIATQTVDIPAGATITNEITWRANKAGVNMPLTVVADPFDNFVEVSEANNKAAVPVTVNADTRPNLTVSYTDMVITPSPVNQSGTANISALVKNEGFSSANNIVVNFYRGVPGPNALLLGTQTLPALGPGEIGQVTLDWTNIPEAGDKIIYVQVDPGNLIPEIREDDNDAFITVTVLTLPDLTLSENSITFDPAFPKDGDKVSVTVALQNTGEQPAENVVVRLSENGSVISQQTVSRIDGNSFANVPLIYDTTGANGAHNISAIIDPENAIIEQSESNNNASRTLGVQDSNLWISEQYFSPNGDGIKDRTELFFKLDIPKTVKVVVVNEKGETVRNFSGPEFENASGGTVSWDGLNDNAMVVDDGQYRMNIVSGNNTVDKSVSVIVDTNRSTLIKAVGTNFIINEGITSTLPKNAQWTWLPDDTGLLVFMPGNDLVYGSGLYVMSPDGRDITRIIPGEWTTQHIYQGSYRNLVYYISDYDISPDGGKVAFTLYTVEEASENGASGITITELWVVDRDGQNLKLLARTTGMEFLHGAQWSPTGEFIVYRSWVGLGTELWSIKPDGTEMKRIDLNYSSWSYSDIRWSPDGSNFAYMYSESDGNFRYLALNDLNGNKYTVPLPSSVMSVEWVDDSKLLVKGWNGSGWKGHLWLVDKNDHENIIELTNIIDVWRAPIAISPDSQWIAFMIYNSGYLYEGKLALFDKNGNKQREYDLNGRIISNIAWSDDSSKILIRTDDQNFIHIINMITGEHETHSIPFGTAPFELSWYSNSVILLEWFHSIMDGHDTRHEFRLHDLEKGDLGTLISMNYNCPSWWFFDRYLSAFMQENLSPLKGYITYPKFSEGSGSPCGKVETWTLTSTLNLATRLSSLKQNSAFVLKGIAQDLNFEGWKLEYNDVNAIGPWDRISPDSDTPVVNDVFTTWIPPYEGAFNMRLSVWDKAGNLATTTKKVIWNKAASVSNFYKTPDMFSPNGDAIADSVELHFTVRQPVHLVFNIYGPDGNLVRTIYSEHAIVGESSISWDGKDESGTVVPDGKYTIKVFDYEFFVTVDSTPPRSALSLGPIKQNTISYEYYAELFGHALDQNLKTWIIEYGEGDNPEEWNQLSYGHSELVKKDINGNPLINPLQDTVITTFAQGDLGFIVGKKIRLTVEDFAGNKSSLVSGFLEEKLVFDRDNGTILPESELQSEFYKLAAIGHHKVGGLNTLRSPIINMNVQYRREKQWFDGSPLISNPNTGIFDLEWNNPGGQINAVRIKAVDVQGTEHFSNVLLTASLIDLDLCELLAKNFLFENLQSLKIYIRSDEDTRYFQWRDFFVINSTDLMSSVIKFILPGDLQTGARYFLKMKGIGVSGNTYTSAIYSYPSNQCDEKNDLSIALDIKYDKAECGLLSQRAEITAKLTISGGSDALLRNLSYYIQKPEGLQLLRQFDLTKERWGGVTLDTSNMPEGGYPVKAVLSFVDPKDNETRESSVSGALIVDRILPEAQITYPDKSAMLCRTKTVDASGEWYGLHTEGRATDNTRVKEYELYYGLGENPSEWMPAMTRTSGLSKPIAGEGPKQGQLGVWDMTSLAGTTFSLRLKVADGAGNTNCTTTAFSIGTNAEITSITADNALFSPNGDETLDNIRAGYSISEDVTVDAKVYRLIMTPSGAETIDTTPVRTIATGIQHLGGTGNVVWDGKGDSGSPTPDGRYGIVVSARDSCGNTVQKWIAVEIDDTPPTAAVTYPNPGDPLGNIVEVRGTAKDLHFQGFALETGQSDAPASWTAISSGTAPLTDGILGTWNTYGLTGKWTFRLTVTDAAGNKTETMLTIDLGTRQNLIKALDATPKLFSANNDGKLDTATVMYELTDVCDARIDILDSGGAVKRTFINSALPAGVHSQVWDGKDDAGMPVADGQYSVRFTAALSSNTAVNQTEAVTVTIDATPPVIDIIHPVNNAYINTNVTVNGSITDQNLQEYLITSVGETGTVSFDQGNQSRSNYTFGTLMDLAEGNYTLTAKSKDKVENSADKAITFTIDRTPPVVKLGAPKDGEYYGADKSVINVTGSLVERNLDVFSLRYGSGDNPSQWTELVTGVTTTAYPSPYAWHVGENDNIPDGLYTLSLSAKDKAGQTGEVKVKVTIDNTAPTAAITSLHDEDYVKQAVEVKGTAFDQNFDKYTIEMSEGRCATAFKWALIKTASAMVQDGILTTWQPLPPDGDYCLRLTVLDKVGLTTEARVNVKVDTHPPAAPMPSGAVEDKTDASLAWQGNTEPDLAGFNLYRDSQKVNTALLTEAVYLDQNLAEGIYTYTVKAVDLAGWESGAANAIRLKIDVTGPEAKIRSPRDSANATGLIDIKGTAYSADDFKQYSVYWGQGSNPATWNLLRTSPVPIAYGSLAQWDTLSISEGVYSLKLVTEDISGNINSHEVMVLIDQTPPRTPVLVSATRTNSDVTVTWTSNSEGDLAGYLLYRNDQFANAASAAISDFKPYLIAGTSYLDTALPDGAFTYYLVAVDSAGNMSSTSNVLNVEIDTHAPKATIVEPLNNSRFENVIFIKAQSPDLDIASIQFQFKRAQDTVWSNLGSPVTESPSVAHLAPALLSLTYGDYHLRAVATDTGSKTDPAPALVTVTYANLNAPAIPLGLMAFTSGDTVTLTWTANTEPDLNGYNVYRTSGNMRTKLNLSAIRQVTYEDGNLADGVYTYEITAIDTFDNESNQSRTVTANVYRPAIAQPYSPVSQRAVIIQGSNAEANTQVEAYVETASGYELRGTATADAGGEFSIDTILALGENRITARVKDSSGNISRMSEPVVVIYNDAPASPTGLSAQVQGYAVNLSWNQSTEQDIEGYKIYRDGQKLNSLAAFGSGYATASSDSYSPSYAIDSNPGTSWMSPYGSATFGPVWWQLEFGSAELISRIEIDWTSDSFSGKDFEIQAWSGYAWIPLVRTQGNSQRSNGFDLQPSYRTGKIRIYITNTNCPYEYKQVGIAEVKIYRDNLFSSTMYQDGALFDHVYKYAVSAVDYFGFESPLTTEVEAAVGDFTPPAAPQEVTAIAMPGGALNITWSSVEKASGYNIYRSLVSGGPYTRLNTSVNRETSYLDTGLVTKTTYYYIVSSVSPAGDEGDYSSEATGIPVDTEIPFMPIILSPTTSGSPATVYLGQTDISGVSEAHSTVELYRNGVAAGTVPTIPQDIVRTIAIGPAYSPAVSPDGKNIAYVYGGTLWLKDIISGQSVSVVNSGYSPAWSGDGSKIAYTYKDSNNYAKIGIYDLATGSVISLADGGSEAHTNASLSWNGSRIAYVSTGVSSNPKDPKQGGSINVWLRDLATGSRVQVSNGIFVLKMGLSPDGLKVAYVGLSSQINLYIYDLNSGTTSIIDTHSATSYLDWSPDSTKIAYVSTRTGQSEIFVYDVVNAKLVQFTDSPDYELNPHWSPDGRNIAFANGVSLRVASYPSGEGRQVQTGNYFNYLTWLNSGQISYFYSDTLYLLYLGAGYFEFKNVPLNPGENSVYVVASDASGNKSEQSGAISLFFDTSESPDVTVTTDDIYFYPPLPVAGEQMAVNIAVWNKGQVTVNDLDVDVYMWTADGQLELLKSERIASLAAGSAELVSAVWDSTGKVGENRLVVVVDAADTIAESYESNNMAIKDFIVTADEGVTVTTALDSTQFAANVNAGIKITAWNNGIKKDGILEAWIEDESGYPVVVFESKTMSLSFGTKQTYDIVWNTGTTYAGSYKVHSVLKDGSGTLGEDIVPFTILPDVTIDAALVTNRTGYGTSENVNLSSTLVNKGQNYMIPVLVAKLRINDSNGNTLFTTEKGMVNLLPGATSSLNSTWNTGNNPPGIYTAVLEVYVDSQMVTTQSASFTIGSVVVISGNMAVSPSIVPVGSTVLADYTISNSGNIDAAGLVVQVQVIDPETEIVMYSQEDMMDLPKNSNRAGQVAFTATGYALKTYSVLVRYTLNNVTKNVNSGSFTVKDFTPPAVVVVSPTEGTTYNSTVTIAVIATDNASGVEKVESRTDSGEWNLLPVSDLSQGRYATNWAPALSDNGPHSVEFRAMDKAGNTSAPVSVSFIIQMDNIPPVTTITVGEPTYESSGNRYVAAGSAFTLNATDNFSGVAKAEYQLDGGSWTAYAGAFALASYGDGKHTIRYRSTDIAGNEESAKELAVIRDTIAPKTIISASNPLINGVINTVSHETTFTLSAEDALSGVRTIAYRIDEGQWQAYTGSFSLTGLGAGQHVIAFKATDNVLNEEPEQTVNVQLVVIEVEKKVAVDSTVLVGLWSDNSDLEQKQADINNLNTLLSSIGMTYTIVLNMDEFTAALRSGRYNTYILIDVKEPLIGEEVREAVHFGNGLIFIKTRQDADPFIDDVFGVKLTGRTTSPDLAVSLVSSSISNENTLQMAGKAIVASLTTETAQTYGSVTDRQEAIPVVIANQYGRGRAILYTFDLLRSPDQAKASALLVGSLNEVRPTEHYVMALDSVPIAIGLTSSTVPVDVKVVEAIPDTTTADTIMPQAALQNNTITWSSILSPDRKTMFTYYLNLPDRAGSYTIDTELKFKNGGDYLRYGDYSLRLMVPYDSAGLLQETRSDLNSITPMNALDAHGITKAISDLSTVDNRAATLKEAEQSIRAIIAAADEVRELSVDTTVLRLKLDELLEVWEKKWYLLQLQE